MRLTLFFKISKHKVFFCVKELKDKYTQENAKGMTGTEDPSEEKCCDNSEEDNYNYYYQEFVKKGSKITKYFYFLGCQRLNISFLSYCLQVF